MITVIVHSLPVATASVSHLAMPMPESMSKTGHNFGRLGFGNKKAQGVCLGLVFQTTNQDSIMASCAPE
jgi:hypothetical protein